MDIANPSEPSPPRAPVDRAGALPQASGAPFDQGARAVIRHIVLVRFAQATPPEEIEAIFAELGALRKTLPGLRAFSAGANTSPEAMARGFSHAFTVDFADAGARDGYLVHPAHQAAGARLVRATEGGLDGLTVIDIAL